MGTQLYFDFCHINNKRMEAELIIKKEVDFGRNEYSNVKKAVKIAQEVYGLADSYLIVIRAIKKDGFYSWSYEGFKYILKKTI